MTTKKEKALSGLPSGKGSFSSDKLPLDKVESITENPKKQDACADFTSKKHTESAELKKKFTPHKTKSLDLAEVYFRLGYETNANRVLGCGDFLQFAHEIDNSGTISPEGKLHHANFCKDRLCPMCAWRRSYKIFGQVSQIMELIGREYKFLFLTLTVPNCTGEALSDTLNRLNSGFYALSRYKAVQKVLKGSFRALEVTYNRKTNMYHPHIHAVLAVPKGYATSRDYIQRDTWLELWKKAYKDDSITQVDIRVAKNKHSGQEENASDFLGSAVAEICKYAVKSDDFLFPDDMELSANVVRTLTSALFHRRLALFTGCFKEAFRKLGLDDAESEDADLTHLSGKLNPALAWLICTYGWSMGAYEMVDSYIEKPENHRRKKART